MIDNKTKKNEIQASKHSLEVGLQRLEESAAFLEHIAQSENAHQSWIMEGQFFGNFLAVSAAFDCYGISKMCKDRIKPEIDILKARANQLSVLRREMLAAYELALHNMETLYSRYEYIDEIKQVSRKIEYLKEKLIGLQR